MQSDGGLTEKLMKRRKISVFGNEEAIISD
jgi:hypothetical protein